MIDQIPGQLHQSQLVDQFGPGVVGHHGPGGVGCHPVPCRDPLPGREVPRDLVEVATVDGANAWQVFRNVTLPILRPLIIIVTTLSVIWAFGLHPDLGPALKP